MTEAAFFEVLKSSDFLSWAKLQTYRSNCTQELEDLLQVVTVKLHNRLKNDFDKFSKKDVQSLLRTSFRRLLISFARSSHYKLARKFTPLTGELLAQPMKSENERLDSIHKGINMLASIQKQVVMLRYFQHLSIDCIARRLTIPKSTVKSHLRRARLELRNNLNLPRN